LASATHCIVLRCENGICVYVLKNAFVTWASTDMTYTHMAIKSIFAGI
jgi:hypothetical protein